MIRQIYEQSRASIKIGEPQQGMATRVAYITGVESQRNEALRLVQERLAEISAAGVTPRQ